MTNQSIRKNAKIAFAILHELEANFGVKFHTRKQALGDLILAFEHKRLRGLDYHGDRVVGQFLKRFLRRVYPDPEMRPTRNGLFDFLKSNDHMNKVMRSLQIKPIEKQYWRLTNESEGDRPYKLEASFLEFIVGLIDKHAGRREADLFLYRYIYKFGDAEAIKEIETLRIKNISLIELGENRRGR